MINEMIERYHSILYRIFYVTLLVCIVIEGFGSFFGVSKVNFSHWLVAVLTLAMVAFWNYGGARGRFVSGVGIVVCFFMVILFIGMTAVEAFVVNYVMWLTGKSGWEVELLVGYEILQIVFLTIGCYLLQIVAQKYKLVSFLMAVGLVMGLAANMIMHREISHFGVVMAMGYLALYYIEETQHKWNKKRSRNHREYVLWLMPFLLLYMVLMMLTPVSKEPYDWKIVKDAYHNLNERFTAWIETRNRKGQEDFSLAMTGFSEDGRLMNGLLENGQELLSIEGSQGLVTNVYLVGKVYDLFDGKQWMATIEDDTRERMLDTLETLYAVESYDAEQKENYVRSTGLSIRYEYFDTGCVFAPLKVKSVDGCDYLEKGSNLSFTEQKGYGTEYHTVYYQINLNHPRFYEMTEEMFRDDEEIWERTRGIYGGKAARNITLQDLELHRQNMKESYLDESALSDRTKGYLAAITKDADSTVQKLVAIERELASYTYTKFPGKLPKEIDSPEDFLEYFLFESKQGYCSYFATAFVLMARAEGIPARYVQGFCVPVTGNKKMTVTAKMAHAWPEVYIEGIGWLPFEPTPGYDEIRYTPWEMQEKTNHDYDNMLMEEEEDIEESAIHEDKVQTGEAEQDYSLGSMIFTGVIVVLFVCVFMFYYEQWLFQRRYEKMTVEKQFLVEVRRNLWVLERLGYIRQPNETLEELQIRAVNGLEEYFCEKRELVFLRGYEEYLYRRKQVSEEMLQIAREERKLWLQNIKHERKLYFYMFMFRLRWIR